MKVREVSLIGGLFSCNCPSRQVDTTRVGFVGTEKELTGTARKEKVGAAAGHSLIHSTNIY